MATNREQSRWRAGDAARAAIGGDHSVDGCRIVPAAALLLDVADASADGDAFACEDVSFLSPLAVREDGTIAATDLRLHYDRSERTYYELVVTDSGEQIARGRLARVGAPPPVEHGTSLNTKALDADDFYRRLAERGNVFGPGLRLVSALRADDTGTLIADIRHASAAGMLDACFHAALTLTLDAVDATPWVIQSIDRLDLVSAAAFADDVRCRIRRASLSQDSLVADLDLETEGAVLLSVRGLRFAALGDEARGAQTQGTLLALANFSLEPMQEAFDWLGSDLGLSMSLGPFDQVLQTLQRGNEALTDAHRQIVVFVDLHRWWIRRHPDEGATWRSGIDAGATPRDLPNGLRILELNSYETDHLFDEIFDQNIYLGGGVALEAGDVVFDIGANIGMFSLQVLTHAPGARVFAFEPSPITAAVLRANLGGRGDAMVLECGVGEREGEASFTHYYHSSVFSGYHANDRDDGESLRAVIENNVANANANANAGVDAKAEVVAELLSDRLRHVAFKTRIVSISDTIDRYDVQRIKLLKIDAEKSELRILSGVAEHHWPRIDRIVMEIHDQDVSASAAIRALLQARGFVIATFEDPILKGSGLSMLVARRPDAGAGAQRMPDVLGLAQPLSQFVSALSAFRTRHSHPVCIVFAPAGDAERASASVRAECASHREALARACASIADCRVQAWDDIAPSAAAVEDLAEVFGDAQIPYPLEWYAAAACRLLRQHAAALRKPHKAVIVDCDNTLWCGACAELGAEGVVVEAGHRALQEKLLALRNAGFLLCLASKNVESDVWDVFDRNPGMRLGRSDIAAARIGWHQKSESIRSLGEELGLAADSFIFIDDSGLECADVAAHWPQTLVLPFPQDDARARRFSRDVWALDHVPASAAPLDRTSLLQAERTRQALLSASQTYADFLQSLELSLRLRPLGGDDVARTSELSRRTTQFNVIPKPMSVAEIGTYLAAPGHDGWVVDLSDRYGDYGTVGFMLAREQGDDLIVDAFLLSCRALGRGVERDMFAHLVEHARAQGASRLLLTPMETARNVPAMRFLERIAVAMSSIHDGGRLRLDVNAEAPARIRAIVDETPPDTAEGTRAPPPADDSASLLDLRYRDGAWQMERAERTADARGFAQALWHIDTTAVQDDLADGTELERMLARLWRAVLGRPVRDRSADFFANNGSSLKLVRLLGLMHERGLGAISLGEAYADPTFAGLTRLAQTASAGSGGGGDAAGDERELSISETALWFEYLADKRSSAYNVPLALILPRGFSVDAVRYAVEAVVASHPNLSTTYRLQGARSLATVTPGSPSFEVLDGRDWSRAQLIEYLHARSRTPINLTTGPLCAAQVIRWREDRPVLLLQMHHVAVDLQSLIVVLDALERELTAAAAPTRAAGAALSDAAVERASYHAFLARQRQGQSAARLTEHSSFWSQELAGIDGDWIWGDSPRDAVGQRVLLPMPEALTRRIDALAAEWRVSRFCLLAAAYLRFVQDYAQRDDVVVGIPMSLRDDVTVAQTVGNFVNLLPLRANFPRATPFADAVAHVRATLERILPHGSLPYQRVARASGRGADLLQTMFACHELHSSRLGGALFGDIVSKPLSFGEGDARVIALPQQFELVDVGVEVHEIAPGSLRLAVKHRLKNWDAAMGMSLAQRFLDSLRGEVTPA